MGFVSAKDTKLFLSFGERRQRPAIDDKARKEFCRQVLRIAALPPLSAIKSLPPARSELSIESIILVTTNKKRDSAPRSQARPANGQRKRQSNRRRPASQL